MKRILIGLCAMALTPAVARAGAKCPNVIIVLDKSGSMGDYPDDDGSGSTDPGSCASNSDCHSGDTCDSAGFCSGAKINVAHQVIQEVMLGGSGVQAPSSLVRFGFTDFPSNNSCGASNYGSSLLVKVGYATENNIASTVTGVEPGGSTPTGPMLKNLVSDPSMLEADRPRYVVIVTDGEPTCGFNNNNNPDGDAVTAVQDLRQAGVETFVVGFGSGVNAAGQATLQSMAAAGSPDAGAFSATNADQLAQALSAIIQQASMGELGGTASCDPCNDIQCPSGQTCDSSTGACVADPYAACEPHPCGQGEYCVVTSSGQTCAVPCTNICSSGQICGIDGTCQADPCANGACGSCPAGQVHDDSGACVASQCSKIQPQCPAGTSCTNNACVSYLSSTSGTTSGSSTSTGGSGSTGTTGKKANGSVTSSGGCSTTDGVAFGAFGLLAMALLARRRD
ncbi:MAG: VWA domain-containing protein [Deltaproteobacteria bacterium]|nr:VWA domain-containing protein [Deltaproteobacteria bacterium]